MTSQENSSGTDLNVKKLYNTNVRKSIVLFHNYLKKGKVFMTKNLEVTWERLINFIP